VEEERVNGSRNLVLAVVFVILAAGFSTASDIYIAQNASGGSNGADCADARAASWFNSSANWGNAGIGPGTTVHLCGTISSPLTIQGSGNSSGPITVLFESGAIMSAPNWGEGTAAITGTGINYITIDGGANGIIQATSNGTELASKVDDTGINLYQCSNCVIRNLTVANMYVHTYTPSDENGQNSGGIYVAGGNNVSVYNNTIHDAKWCLSYSFPTGSSYSTVALHGNTAYNCDHGVSLQSGGNGANNTIYDGYLWDDSANYNHHDAIHTWAVQSGTSISGLMIYDNYIHGNWGFGLNSFIFMESNSGGTENNSLAFNNLLVDATTLGHTGCGYICNENNSTKIYNNTIVGQNLANGIGINMYGTNVSVENNLVSTMLEAVGLPGGSSILVWDYNNYYNIGSNGWNGSSTFVGWQSGEHCDSHSAVANPDLSANYSPTASSTALIQKGADLSSLSVSLLDLDKGGVTRPSMPTLWDIGAFQYGSSPAPAPPTGLVVSVQ
jgi:hypothetical protein